MKTTIITLAALFTCHALCAQEPPRRSAGGGLAERFKQLDRKGDGKPWNRVATLTLPAEAPHTHIYSVEPIAPQVGAGGQSWFSLNAMSGATGRNLGATGRSAKDGSIWVLNLGDDPAKRIARRVDEGALSGIQTTRYEAESMLGDTEVFVYYERKSPDTGRGELRRCRTGIYLK
jgi:hypothetical protein